MLLYALILLDLRVVRILIRLSTHTHARGETTSGSYQNSDNKLSSHTHARGETFQVAIVTTCYF